MSLFCFFWGCIFGTTVYQLNPAAVGHDISAEQAKENVDFLNTCNALDWRGAREEEGLKYQIKGQYTVCLHTLGGRSWLTCLRGVNLGISNIKQGAESLVAKYNLCFDDQKKLKAGAPAINIETVRKDRSRLEVLLIGQPAEFGIDRDLALPEYKDAIITDIAPDTKTSNRSFKRCWPSDKIREDLEGKQFERVIFPVGIIRTIAGSLQDCQSFGGDLREVPADLLPPAPVSPSSAPPFEDKELSVAKKFVRDYDLEASYGEYKTRYSFNNPNEKTYLLINEESEKDPKIESARQLAKKEAWEKIQQLRRESEELQEKAQKQVRELAPKRIRRSIDLAWEFLKPGGRLIICDESENEFLPGILSDMFEKSQIKDLTRHPGGKPIYYNPLLPSKLVEATAID